MPGHLPHPSPGHPAPGRPRQLALAAGGGLLAAALFLAWAYPGPPELWRRLDFNGAPFEDFSGPYYGMARALPDAAAPVPGYHYPAFFALALAPLARLGPSLATAVWLALQLAALVVLVALPLCIAPARSAREVAVYVALAALSQPLLHNLYWGQVSAPLCALLLLALVVGARGARGWEGALIGLATAVKLVPALFLLGPLVQARRRTVLVGVATALALLVLPALAFQGPSHALEFQREVFARLSALGARVADPALGQGSQDLAAACARWLRFEGAFTVGRIAGLGLALALLVRLRNVRAPGLVFAHLALLAPLLVAPTWSHGLAFLPAAAWFVWRDGDATHTARAAAVAAALLSSMPVHALFRDAAAHAGAGVGAAAVLALAFGLLARRTPTGAS